MLFLSSSSLGRDYTWVDLILSEPVPHHLHDDGDVVNGDAVESIQHGLPVEPDVQA